MVIVRANGFDRFVTEVSLAICAGFKLGA